MLKFNAGLLLLTSAFFAAPRDRFLIAMPDPDPAAGGGGGGNPPPGGGGNPPPGGGAAPWAFPTEKAFAEYLPEEFKAEPSFRDIKDFPGLLKTFVSGQKMIGADKATILALPKEGDEKAWGEFYNRTGRPETADKYKVPGRADGNAYSEADVAFHKQVLPILHKAGASQKLIDQVVPQWNAIIDGIAAQQGEQTKAEMERANGTLKEKWGNAYEDKLKLADTALSHFGEQLKLGDALTKELESTKLGNSPALAEVFAHLGKQLQEDGVIGRGEGGHGGGLSPAEAQQQIAAKQGDQAFMKQYTSKESPGHKEAVAAMKALYEAAYPAKSAA